MTFPKQEKYKLLSCQALETMWAYHAQKTVLLGKLKIRNIMLNMVLDSFVDKLNRQIKLTLHKVKYKIHVKSSYIIGIETYIWSS